MLPLLIDLPGRDGAREAARHELDKQAYQDARPSATTRAIKWLWNKVSELLDSATGSVPGGRIGVVLIGLLVVLLIAVVVVRLRPSIRDHRSDDIFGGGHVLTADEHRSLAEAAAARGAFDEAVRERLRAVVRELEERGVLDSRPGRTAAEVSLEAGRAVPELVTPLRRGATTFEQIWYGGQAADASSYAVLVEVDRVVGQARLAARD